MEKLPTLYFARVKEVLLEPIRGFIEWLNKKSHDALAQTRRAGLTGLQYHIDCQRRRTDAQSATSRNPPKSAATHPQCPKPDHRTLQQKREDWDHGTGEYWYAKPKIVLDKFLFSLPPHITTEIAQRLYGEESPYQKWPHVPYTHTEGRECIAYNHWFDSLDERDQKRELAAIKRRYYAYYEDRIARAKKHHEDIMRRPEPPSPNTI